MKVIQHMTSESNNTPILIGDQETGLLVSNQSTFDVKGSIAHDLTHISKSSLDLSEPSFQDLSETRDGESSSMVLGGILVNYRCESASTCWPK